MLSPVQPPIGIRDIDSARMAIERSYALIGQLSQSTKVQFDLIKTLAASGKLTPAQLTTINQQLTVAGSTPIDLTGLIGAGGGSVVFGTWTEMQAVSPSGLFFVTDRTALYAANGDDWTLMAGNQGGSFAAKYADFSGNDEGYLWFDQDRGDLLRWTGAAWRWETGIYISTFANRPVDNAAPDFTSITTGCIFGASDRGYQMWRYNKGTAIWTFIGGGTPTAGVIANITAGLTANDVGYLYYATDFDRLYVWTGAAYADAPGQPTRKMMADFDIAAPTGWAPCDGSVVTISTATGGTTNYTTQDFVTGTPYARYSNGTATGTFGAAGAVDNYVQVLKHVRL